MDGNASDNTIVKGLRIESLYFKYLTEKIGRDYEIHKNVKIGQYGYDIVAYSRKDNMDILYEIKYCNSIVLPSMLKRTCQRMCEAEAEYETYTHRNKRSILVIVSNNEAIREMKGQRLVEDVKEKYQIDIEFVEEKSLHHRDH